MKLCENSAIKPIIELLSYLKQLRHHWFIGLGKSASLDDGGTAFRAALASEHALTPTKKKCENHAASRAGSGTRPFESAAQKRNFAPMYDRYQRAIDLRIWPWGRVRVHALWGYPVSFNNGKYITASTNWRPISRARNESTIAQFNFCLVLNLWPSEQWNSLYLSQWPLIEDEEWIKERCLHAD